jgi:endo-1,4-beta-D-glucanase Y
MYLHKMGLNKEFIEWFNKNKTKELYKDIFQKNIKNSNLCRICGDIIYYYDSTFTLKKDGRFELKGKSCESVKCVDRSYYLTVCEDCLSKKFPEYQNKNKSRVFNQMNHITEFAFEIPTDISKKWVKKKQKNTQKCSAMQKKVLENCGREDILAIFEQINILKHPNAKKGSRKTPNSGKNAGKMHAKEGKCAQKEKNAQKDAHRKGNMRKK